MKNIKYFSILILLVAFTIALVRCSKEEINTKTDKEQIESRDINPCGPPLGCGLTSKPVPMEVPGFSGCILQAEMIYELCQNTYRFYDCIMIVPNSPECDALRAYIDGLTDDQRSAFKDWVAAEGRKIVMQEYSDQNLDIKIYEVTSYRYLCRQECKWLDLDCAADEYVGDPALELRGGGINNRGGGPGCWKYGTVACGEGCCITNSTYVRGIDGKLVLRSAYSTPYGDCQSINTGAIPKWPHYKYPCGVNGAPLSPCKYKCD